MPDYYRVDKSTDNGATWEENVERTSTQDGAITFIQQQPPSAPEPEPTWRVMHVTGSPPTETQVWPSQ